MGGGLAGLRNDPSGTCESSGDLLLLAALTSVNVRSAAVGTSGRLSEDCSCSTSENSGRSSISERSEASRELEIVHCALASM